MHKTPNLEMWGHSPLSEDSRSMSEIVEYKHGKTFIPILVWVFLLLLFLIYFRRTYIPCMLPSTWQACPFLCGHTPSSTLLAARNIPLTLSQGCSAGLCMYASPSPWARMDGGELQREHTESSFSPITDWHTVRWSCCCGWREVLLYVWI